MRVSNVATFKAAASALLDRVRWARQAGIAFGGDRDYYAVLGYPRELTVQMFREEYLRGGIATRIVEAFPRATWRGGAEIFEDENPDVSTPFEQAWQALEQRLNVWAMLQRVDTLAGLSTFGVLLIGAPGDLDTELPKGTPESLLYLSPFIGGGGPSTTRQSMTVASEVDASVATFDTDPSSTRFGEPSTYTLRRTDFASPAFMRPVHWSRIIHVAEGCLDDNVFGKPVLENVWNLLMDLLKVTGGGAEAFWLRANAGLQFNIDKDMALAPTADELTALREQAEDYKHQITRMLRTRGVEVNQLGSDVANFNAPAEAILTQIAGSKGIPMRILTGSERGELASTQDAANFEAQVQDRRTGYAGPMIVRRLVDRLIAYGYLPTPKQYEVGWPTVETMTEMEKAKGAHQWALTNQTQGAPVYTDAEIREHWHNLNPLTEAQIAEIDARKAAAQPVPAPGDEQGGEPTDDEQGDDEPEPRTASADTLALLDAAIASGNREVADRILADHETVPTVLKALEAALASGDAETLHRMVGVTADRLGYRRGGDGG